MTTFKGVEQEAEPGLRARPVMGTLGVTWSSVAWWLVPRNGEPVGNNCPISFPFHWFFFFFFVNLFFTFGFSFPGFFQILPDSSRFFQILPDSSRFFGMLGLSLPPCPVIDFLFFGFSFSYFSAIFFSFSLSFFQILEIFDWLIDLYRLIRIVGDAGPLGGMLSSHWSSQIAVVRNVAARWPVPFSLEAWWMLLGNWSPQRFSEFFDWIFNIQQNGGGFFRSAGDQWDIDDCNDLIVLKRTISMEKKAIDWGLRIDSGSATGRERLRKPLNPPGRFREEGPAEARSTGPHGAAPERFGIGGERGYAIKGGGRRLPNPPTPSRSISFRAFHWLSGAVLDLRFLCGFSADAQRMLRITGIIWDSCHYSEILWNSLSIPRHSSDWYALLPDSSGKFRWDILPRCSKILAPSFEVESFQIPQQGNSSAIPVPFQCHSSAIPIELESRSVVIEP